MQERYICLKKNASFFSKRLMVASGLLALPITLRLERGADAQPAPPAKPGVAAVAARQPVQAVTVDPRPIRLKKFLARLRCPVAPLADEFVNAADDNHLDWRLLPSIRH
jgi:hypothetical protein